MPAILPFPDRGSLLIKARTRGGPRPSRLLQAVMLRYLTSIPPGKVRFTIIDPVGLGENFAAFMHLADYDELLVTSRIWTEPPHIEQRLADLTAHMENVIQKYLRNEFATIEEYNAQAGEVAEPFRVLVVANFPANFNETAARRLVSIAASGARCGVYTLIARRHQAAAAAGLPARRTSSRTASTSTWKDGRLALATTPTSRRSRWRSTPRPTPSAFTADPARRRRRGPRRQPRRGPVRVHRPAAGRLVDRATAARASTSRSAGPAPPSCST